MSLYNGPPRPGARGGRDQFNWENVKSDKDREFYLGHSVKASVGRWQKGKDILWYTRDKKDDGESGMQSELATVKAREEELMLEALGLKPKSARPQAQPKLDQREMKQLLEGNPEEEEQAEDPAADADRVRGIGYSAGQILGAAEAEREVLAGVGMSMPPSSANQQVRAARGGSSGLPPPPNLSSKELKKLRKAQRKEEKKLERKAKKQARKEARAAKRAKRAAKREGGSGEKRRRHDSDSDSHSSESESDSDASPPPGKRARHSGGDQGNEGRRDDSRIDDRHLCREHERHRSGRDARHRSPEMRDRSRSPRRRHHSRDRSERHR